jgi:hypothetical protein
MGSKTNTGEFLVQLFSQKLKKKVGTWTFLSKKRKNGKTVLLSFSLRGLRSGFFWEGGSPATPTSQKTTVAEESCSSLSIHSLPLASHPPVTNGTCYCALHLVACKDENNQLFRLRTRT